MLKKIISLLALTSLLGFINTSINAKQIKNELIVIMANNNFAEINLEEKKERANFLFREMMKDFPQCKIEGAYLSEQNGINQPKNIFFKENNLYPYKIEDDFAYYKLNIDYYGISCSRIIDSRWHLGRLWSNFCRTFTKG